MLDPRFSWNDHFDFMANKTGTRQCTWAVWSTFADIHSTRYTDALFGVTGISSYLWCLTRHDTHETYLIYPMNAISENMMIRQYKIRQRMQNIFKFIFTGRHNLHIRCVQLTRGEVASLSEQDLLTAGHQLRKERKVIPRNVCIAHTQKNTIILPVFEYCSCV